MKWRKVPDGIEIGRRWWERPFFRSTRRFRVIPENDGFELVEWVANLYFGGIVYEWEKVEEFRDSSDAKRKAESMLRDENLAARQEREAVSALHKSI